MGRWVFLAYEVFVLVHPSSGCVSGLLICLALLEGETKHVGCARSLCSRAVASESQGHYLGARAFRISTASVLPPLLTSQFVCQDNVT